jgi:cellulose synthase/poly-beta-1,6-N-acetylglucosamine synthase-like glycosyltransferase
MHVLLLVVCRLATIVLWMFALYQVVFCLGGYLLFRRSRQDREAALLDQEHLPPVTIIVPAHNEEKVIERTVLNLLALDYPADRLDILVVEDASTDATPEIMDRLVAEHAQVRVLHRSREEGGKGKAAALNHALTLVKNEFIAIYDADNGPEPHALTYLVDRLQKQPELGAAVGRFRTGNKFRNLLTRFINIEGLAFQGIVQSGRWQWLHVAALTGTNYIIRRSVLEQVEGWDEEALTEDTELSVRLYQAGFRIAFVPYSVTWEQEPETLRVWLKQRTRWARGNNYAIAKLLRNFAASRSKPLALEALFTLMVPYFFMYAILASQIAIVLWLMKMNPADYFGNVAYFWVLAMSLYLAEVTIALSYDHEASPLNVLLAASMYYTYCQAWLVAVLCALWADCVVRKSRTWDKTVRFDTEILPHQCNPDLLNPADASLAAPLPVPEVSLMEDPISASSGSGAITQVK